MRLKSLSTLAWSNPLSLLPTSCGEDDKVGRKPVLFTGLTGTGLSVADLPFAVMTYLPSRYICIINGVRTRHAVK